MINMIRQNFLDQNIIIKIWVTNIGFNLYLSLDKILVEVLRSLIQTSSNLIKKKTRMTKKIQ